MIFDDKIISGYSYELFYKMEKYLAFFLYWVIEL